MILIDLICSLVDFRSCRMRYFTYRVNGLILFIYSIEMNEKRRKQKIESKNSRVKSKK